MIHLSAKTKRKMLSQRQFNHPEWELIYRFWKVKWKRKTLSQFLYVFQCWRKEKNFHWRHRTKKKERRKKIVIEMIPWLGRLTTIRAHFLYVTLDWRWTSCDHHFKYPFFLFLLFSFCCETLHIRFVTFSILYVWTDDTKIKLSLSLSLPL